MERNANSSRNSLSLTLSTTTPSYIGGSSAATATMAGIAALVWSVKSTLTRQQVYDILKNTAQFANTTSNHGFGNPNAAAAVTLALTY
jgi:serine protease